MEVAPNLKSKVSLTVCFLALLLIASFASSAQASATEAGDPAAKASGAIPWPNGSAKGLLLFDVSFQMEDKADWDYDRIDDESCFRNFGKGSHEIKGSASGNFAYYLPIAFKRGRPVVLTPSNGTWSDSETAMDTARGPATYKLDSTEGEEQLRSGFPCDGIVTNDPDAVSSDPPTRRCGTKKGNVKLSLLNRPGGAARNDIVLTVYEDDWQKPDPFSPENNDNHFCNDASEWAWTNGFPAIDNPEHDSEIVIDTKKLLGYFRNLSPKQQAGCRRPPAYRPKRICNRAADYSRTTKTLNVRNDPLPKKFVLNQTSRATITFEYEKFIIPKSPRR